MSKSDVNEGRNESVPVYIEPSIKERFTKLAHKQRRSASSLARIAIMEFLEREAEKQAEAEHEYFSKLLAGKTIH